MVHRSAVHHSAGGYPCEIVNGSRPSLRAISRTPTTCAPQNSDLHPRRKRQVPRTRICQFDRRHSATLPAPTGPTAEGTPFVSAAQSEEKPFTILSRTRVRCCAELPARLGEIIADRPSAGLPINTSSIIVLRRPVESALATSAGMREIANDAARSCVVPPWRDGGQAQYIRRPVAEPASTTTAQARVWALEHLHRPVVLAELAAQSRMSVRTFSRRFRDEVGLSPMTWLTQQRVERARQLLESTDLPIDRVVEEAGFGSAGSIRQHLLTSSGVSPNAYRRTFHAAVVAPSGKAAVGFLLRRARVLFAGSFAEPCRIMKWGSDED